MLKQRLIAKILIEDGVAVKYKEFTRARRVVGDPVSTVRTLEDQRVDEFLFCFIGRYDADLVRRMSDAAFVPVTVAGGIRTVDDAKELIGECGVEKVVMKDGAAVADKFGKQSVVWPCDYLGDAGFMGVPEWAGEMILTSVDRDGMGTGFETAALRYPYDVPVVISGGCGKLVHVKEAFEAGASGVAIASMFAFTDKSPVKLRSWLISNGANVRAA